MTYFTVKTAKMSPQKYGDWVEKTTQDALDEIMKTRPMAFSRLYDTKAAGSYLPNQAGDFRGTAAARGFLLEVKATQKYDSLAEPGAMKGLIKPHQALASYLECRAGGQGLFLFRSSLQGVLEMWDGSVVREAYVTPRGNLKGLKGCLQRLVGIHDSDLPAVIQTMLETTL